MIRVRTISTDGQAKAFLKECATKIGQGFHPDTMFGEYQTEDGKPLFTHQQVFAYETMMDSVCDILGEDLYEVAEGFLQEEVEA